MASSILQSSYYIVKWNKVVEHEKTTFANLGGNCWLSVSEESVNEGEKGDTHFTQMEVLGLMY